jgi:uncharacterized membrane protein
VILVLMVFYLWTKHASPFLSPQVERLELVSLQASCLILFFAVLVNMDVGKHANRFFTALLSLTLGGFFVFAGYTLLELLVIMDVVSEDKVGMTAPLGAHGSI